MFDIQLIRDNYDLVQKNLKRRRDDAVIKKLHSVKVKDDEWRKLKSEVDVLRQRRNQLSAEINSLKKEGKPVTKILAEAKHIPDKIKNAEEKLVQLEKEVREGLMRLPNLLDEEVPYGVDSEDNAEVRKWGTPKKFDFELKPHGELMEFLGIGDFERSAKVAGAGFYYLKGGLAMLNMALVKFAIDFMVKKGYLYTEPPLMLKRVAYEGVTDLADFENVMYKIEGEDLYLIATSEHPLVSQFMNEVIEEEKLPIKLAGYSMCFRREIGSRGVDTKGLFRTHQFNKVEQIIFCTPEQSKQLHEEITKNAEEIYKLLEIPYRIVNICTGDIGIVAAKKYDLEAWFPRQNKYGEVGSSSNCTDYQARRLNVKCVDRKGERRILHTLNNTAIATSRCMVAILENYQNKDSTVTVPKALIPYMNGMKKIEAVKKV
ncbi:MAG: serine--tRNA ligase [Nanoarchaeota archaeon]